MYRLQDLLQRIDWASTSGVRRAISIGFLLAEWAGRPSPANRSLAWCVDRLLRAFELGQLELFFDDYGRFSGHVLWSGFDESLHERLIAGGPETAGPLELGEGPHTWILDASLRNGVLDEALLAMRDLLWPRAGEVFYFRVRPAGWQARVIRRAPHLALFRRSACVAWGHTSAAANLRASARHGHAARAEISAAAELGCILLLLRRCGSFSRVPLRAVMTRIRAAMRQGLTRLHCNAEGDPMAFVSWGWMQPAALTADAPPLHALPAPRWSDGTALVLCDAVAVPDAVGWIDETLRSGWFSQEPLHLYPSDWQAGLRPAGACWLARERVKGWADASVCAESADPKSVIDVARILGASRRASGGSNV